MSPAALPPTTENVRTVADCVRDGGVVVAPSDTNMALTVSPDRPDAIDRVYDIKDRPAHKPLTLFVRDPTAWRRVARHDEPGVVDALAEAFWPGPLNLVLERDSPELDDRCGMDGTVSVGCLSNPVWRDLADAAGVGSRTTRGGPHRLDSAASSAAQGSLDETGERRSLPALAMTSANRSGTVPDDRLVDVDLAAAHVGDAVDHILGGEPDGTTRASTILSLAAGDDGHGRILRQGDLTAQAIEGATALTVE